MYTTFQLARKYVKFYLTASNGKGHGIHSPFVFDFIKFVLNDQKEYEIYSTIERQRAILLKDKRLIDVEDFGAGSTSIKTRKRLVKDIAASSLKPKKFSQLLYRMVQYYNIKRVLELGTSFGITTAYLASAESLPIVTSMEGSHKIAEIARQNFKLLGCDNIGIIEGAFENTLPDFLVSASTFDFVFLDGNHRKLATLNYFEQILSNLNAESIVVFDDIHWSKEMEEAWEIIKMHESVTLTIDLFFIGIVFLKKDFKVKQHFTIRF